MEKVDLVGRASVSSKAGGGGRGDQDRLITPQDGLKIGQDDNFYSKNLIFKNN